MEQDEQKLLALSDNEAARLAEQRSLIESYLADDESRRKYQTSAGKLGLIQTLIDNKVFTAIQTYELQSMGVVLGDVFADELGMEWIVVEDSFGETPALQYPNTTILLYPLTMISKRIEAEEEVDVFDMFNTLAAEIGDILQELEN